MQVGKLTKRNRRALLLLGGFLGAYILVFYLVLPFYDRQSEIGGKITSSRQEVERYLKALTQQTDYQGQLEAVQATLQSYEEGFLQVRDVNTATLRLEETVRNLAAQHQIRVTRSNSLPDRKIGEQYAKVSVQLNLEGEYEALIGFIHAVSSFERFLLVEEFQITSFRVRDETRLQPRLRIAGFIRLS